MLNGGVGPVQGPPAAVTQPATTAQINEGKLIKSIKSGSVAGAAIQSGYMSIDGVDFAAEAVVFNNEEAARQYLNDPSKPSNLPQYDFAQGTRPYVLITRLADGSIRIHNDPHKYPAFLEEQAKIADQQFEMCMEQPPTTGQMAGATQGASLYADQGSVCSPLIISQMHPTKAWEYILTKLEKISGHDHPGELPVGGTIGEDGTLHGATYYPIVRASAMEKALFATPFTGHADELMMKARMIKVQVSNISQVGDNVSCTVNFNGKVTDNFPMPIGMMGSGEGEYYISSDYWRDIVYPLPEE